MLDNPKEIDSLNIFIPDSSIEEKDHIVCDLSEKLLNISVLSAVFNSDLTLNNSIAAYQHKVEDNNKEEDNAFTLHELTDEDVVCDPQYEGLLVKIKVPNNNGKLYIRVRLDAEALKHCISEEALSNSFIQKWLSK